MTCYTTGMPRTTFDEPFFKRFYSRTPVHSRRKIESLATAVHNMCTWWDVRISSVLDVGAGLGYWRDWYASNHPRVKVCSIDVSEYACTKYHHELRDISTWRPSRAFDLVLCQSVLQYLSNSRADVAIEHLAAATKRVMYFEVPTSSDLKHIVDRRSTDFNIYARSGEWYRKRLTKHFTHAGAGLWLSKTSGITLYEFERGCKL
ncbi:MAG: class I SAM-dependent methyltransferase [Actinomycetota bacterium]